MQPVRGVLPSNFVIDFMMCPGRRGMAFVGFGYQAKAYVQETYQLYLLYALLLLLFIYTLYKR